MVTFLKPWLGSNPLLTVFLVNFSCCHMPLLIAFISPDICLFDRLNYKDKVMFYFYENLKFSQVLSLEKSLYFSPV